MSDRDVVRPNQRNRHSPLLRRSRLNRLNKLNRNVTLQLCNANNDALSRNNVVSRTNSGELTVAQRRLNVPRDLCDNNSRRANASRRQHARSNNSAA